MGLLWIGLVGCAGTSPATLCQETRWIDRDGDGHGDPAVPLAGCAHELPTAMRGDDCDDTDPTIFPGAGEIGCDGVDDDCDGAIDDLDPQWTGGVVFLDTDGDGYGDAATSTVACPSDRWSSQAGDCDDAAAAVYPTAPEHCDGVDNDCDGVMLPGEDVDGDGDGAPICIDCDDTDPMRSPLKVEACTPEGEPAIDEDCDGDLDLADDSVDPYTCGHCPVADPYLVDTTEMVWEEVDPCLLDPDATLMCEADRRHRIGWRTDEGIWREPLLVFLPPADGHNSHTWLEWGAYAGYRVISVMYPNEDLLQDSCSTAGDSDKCRADGRHDVMYGGSSHPLVSIPKADSLAYRLVALLEDLVARHPDMGFDTYLDGAGGVRWDRVVVSGWSRGGGQAGYITQVERVRGAIYLSAPSGDDYGGGPADWVVGGPTPGCAMYATYHAEERMFQWMEPIWDLLGIPKASWDVDLQPGPVPEGTHRISQSTLDLAYGCNPHGATGNDNCVRDEVLESYLYLLCRASDGCE